MVEERGIFELVGRCYPHCYRFGYKLTAVKNIFRSLTLQCARTSIRRLSIPLFALLYLFSNASNIAAESIPTIEVFVASRCPDCDDLEDFLNNAGIPYRRIDLENDRSGERDYIENIGRGILPAARLNGARGSVIRGFDPSKWKSIERSISRGETKIPSGSIYEQQPPPNNTQSSFDLSRTPDSKVGLRNGRQPPPASANEQSRSTNDVRIQFVRQGDGRVAGIDGLEVVFTVSDRVFRTNTNQFGIAEVKDIPCNENIKITSVDFARFLPNRTWEAKAILNCSANSRLTDLGVYSNFAGQKVSDTQVKAIGLSRQVNVPEEFSDESLAKKRDASNPKPRSPKRGK